MTESIIPLTRGQAVLTRQSKSSDDISERARGPRGFLCFGLDDQEYGVDLNIVCQIVKPPALAWVPRIEPHILGIVSIRGAVVTLVDMRQLMDLEPTPWPRTARVLIVDLEGEQIGLLVDRVSQVRRIEMADLEKKPAIKEGLSADYVLSIARPGGGDPIVIIDLDMILGERLR